MDCFWPLRLWFHHFTCVDLCDNANSMWTHQATITGLSKVHIMSHFQPCFVFWLVTRSTHEHIFMDTLTRSSFFKASFLAPKQKNRQICCNGRGKEVEGAMMSQTVNKHSGTNYCLFHHSRKGPQERVELSIKQRWVWETREGLVKTECGFLSPIWFWCGAENKTFRSKSGFMSKCTWIMCQIACNWAQLLLNYKLWNIQNMCVTWHKWKSHFHMWCSYGSDFSVCVKLALKLWGKLLL